MGSAEKSTGGSLPNMADVLKGLDKVKLRSVERYVHSSFTIHCRQKGILRQTMFLLGFFLRG